MKKYSAYLAVFVAAVLLSLPASTCPAATTQFNFNGNLDSLYGPGSMIFAGGVGGTGSVVSWGTASSFGLPAMPGGDAKVMQYPAFTPAQGLLLDTACSANGGGQGINVYTMIFDILLPDVSNMPEDYASFYQATPDNSDDGELFVQKSSRGVGIRGDYAGTIQDNTWYRMAVKVENTGAHATRAAKSLIKVYLDGEHANTITVVSDEAWTSEEAAAMGYKRDTWCGVDGRWTLYPTESASYTWLLADEDPETGAGYISSYLFTDRVLTEGEIASLGGTNAYGCVLPGDANADGSVDLLDLTILGGNWRGNNKKWTQGDFNSDGIVDLLDLTILGGNWRDTGVSFAQALKMVNLDGEVPEPGTLALLACGLAALAIRAWRRR